MKYAKTALTILGGAVLVVALAGLMAPKAIRAAASALVTIVNTSANPVPTYPTVKGQNVFEFRGTCNFVDGVYCVASTIPSQIVVIENFSGTCILGAGTTVLPRIAYSGLGNEVWTPPAQAVATPVGLYANWGQTVKAYALPNLPINVGVTANAMQPNGSYCVFEVDGYLVQ